MITFTGVFFHGVSDWEAEAESGIPAVTPGRIAYTHYSPGPTMRSLKGKPEDWMTDTMGGLRRF